MTNQLDAAYWQGRYNEAATGWDIGYVSPPLKQYFETIKDRNSRILIPGAGNSYEAQHLHEQGFTNVFVCDVAKHPLDNLLKRCPTFPTENLLLCDFFSLDPKVPFDYVFEQTFFCALNPVNRPAYFLKMHDLLSKNGKLVGLLFDDPLNADKPPFGGTRNEYLGYFEGLFTPLHFEPARNSIPQRTGRELFMELQKKATT